jgi:hypothetical protein
MRLLNPIRATASVTVNNNNKNNNNNNILRNVALKWIKNELKHTAHAI